MQYPTGCHGDSSCTILPCAFAKIYDCIHKDDAMPLWLLWLLFILMIMHEVNINVIHNNYYSIQSFFKTFAPNESAPYGIQPEVMDTYVKSCGKLW